MPRGPWPPASPYVWITRWNDRAGNPMAMILTFNFDSPVNGSGTNALQSLDYDLDPRCPWEFIIIVKSDGVIRLTRQIPRAARTGSITAVQLHNFGLDSFLDIGSITVGDSPN